MRWPSCEGAASPRTDGFAEQRRTHQSHEGRTRASPNCKVAACFPAGIVESYSSPAGKGGAMAHTAALVEVLKRGSYHERLDLGVDESVMWGEYFFVEALDKLLGAPALS